MTESTAAFAEAAGAPSAFAAAAPGAGTDTVLPALPDSFKPFPTPSAEPSGTGVFIATVALEDDAEGSTATAAAAGADSDSGAGSFFKLIFAPVLGGSIADGLTLTVAAADEGGATWAVCPLSAVGGGVTVVPPAVAGRIFNPVVAVDGNFGGMGVASWGSGCGVAAGLLSGVGSGTPVGFFIASFIVEDGTASTAGFEEALF